MIPRYLLSIFWDTNLDTLKPEAYPDYTIFRVLEYGDEEAAMWISQTFPEAEVRRVLCAEHRLSRKSANYKKIHLLKSLAPILSVSTYRCTFWVLTFFPEGRFFV